jgi:hypothetical protein
VKDLDFQKLRTAVEWSIRQLQEPRENRVHAVRQFVGTHYAGSGAEKRVPTNLLELAVTIYVRHLAARAPRVMVSTGADHLKPYSRNMQLALNQIPEEIKLGRTVRRAVIEAIFGIGVVKVGLCSSGVCVLGGHDAGEPFVDLVSLDDYFLDMSAKSPEGIQFEGNDYWLPMEAARALMEEGSAEDVEPDEHTISGNEGESRAEAISSDEGADLYEDKVWLRDVWLPDTREVVTYGVKTLKLYRVVPWDGPEHGPYYTLRFSDVPGNLLPLPPAALWIDLHELANSLFRKLAKQADAKKTVATFGGGNEESVEALKAAADGEGIRYSGPKPEPLTVGGVDPQTMAFFLQTRDLFSYFAGNLDALGGLSPMTDTVGQDKLLTDAAGARIDRMKADTFDFVKGIFKALAWYEWTDPVRKRVIEKPLAEGSDLILRQVWSAETREGDFLDYNFDIDVYSMEEDTPSLRLQKLGTALERFVFPVLPQIQEQGGQIDFKKLIEMIGRLGNIDELRSIVTFQEPIQGKPQQGGDANPSMKPAHTTRTYERVNRPGATRAGKDGAMSRLLMGSKVQGAEAAALGRPTG